MRERKIKSASRQDVVQLKDFSMLCKSAKSLKKCVYFCDGYREFFTLCLIRQRERVRRKDGGKKTERCSECEEMCVCACFCPAPAS